MNDFHKRPDFEECDRLLRELIDEVKYWKSNLAGGRQVALGDTALERLFKTEITFGNPRDKLIRLTEDNFQSGGAKLSEIYRQQMADTHDFYSMTLTVNLRPKPGVQFRRLCCELDWSPKGEKEAIVQGMFPKNEWRTLMEWGAGMDLGLNENLDWTVGVDSSSFGEIARLPGELKGKVSSKNDLKAFVVVPDYQYQIGRSEITALGEGSSTCYWYIKDADMQKRRSLELSVLFKVPRGVEAVQLRGVVWAEPNMNWLTADLKEVFRELSDRLQSLLKSQDEAARKLARGLSETWDLKLPNAIN